MKLSKIVCLLILTCSLSSCGQIHKNHKHQNLSKMESEKLKNVTVKAAFNAWQNGDSKLWISFFTNDAQLFDDGHIRDFNEFSTEAIGHERFTSIDKVEDNGLSIYGKFHSDTWGDFKTYFKFQINSEGKIFQLHIGQVNY
jgi:hypothetical protein